MRFSLTTWNINSVRLRIDLVAKFLKSVRPDVLCLQETKCIDDAFPLKRFRRLGYEHVALNGQKGYHGVAVISKLPFETTNIRTFCDKIDSRHISVAFGEKAQLSKPLVLHNFYVPAGGDIPDPALNPKFEHKLRFLDEMKACEPLHPRGDDRHILVGDLNVAPHENDVWSHRQLLKVVSHTPIECEKLLAAQAHGEWVDVARERIPLSEKVYTWWSYRAADWTLADRGRRLDHIWVSRALQGGRQRFPDHQGCARLGAAVRPRAGHGDAGGLDAQLGARHQDIAGDLAGAVGEFVAQPARRGGIAFQHPLKQAARDPDHRGMLQRDRGRGPLHRHHQRKFADQGAGTRDDLGAAAVLDPERAALNDESGVGIVAGIEQHIAAGEIALLGADRQHAQSGRPQQAQCRDALEQGNIIFDRHEKPVIAPIRIVAPNRITAPACSHRLPSPVSRDWRRLSRSSAAAGRCGFPGCAW